MHMRWHLLYHEFTPAFAKNFVELGFFSVFPLLTVFNTVDVESK